MSPSPHSSAYPGYVSEYQRWVDSLSPQEREELKRLGVDQPDVPSDYGNGRDRDLADSPLASETPDMAENIDDSASTSGQVVSTEMGTAGNADEMRGDILASFCARLRSCANPTLVFDAICYATGVYSLEGASATELAARHGVTKQAFSKVAVRWCETYGLRPSRSMKSEKARESYRKRMGDFHTQRQLTRKHKL